MNLTMWLKAVTIFVMLACFHATLVVARIPVCQICVSPEPSPTPDYPEEPVPAPLPEDNGVIREAVVFDVTKHGAAADGSTESSLAFMRAWKAACDHPGKSTMFYIPEGTFLLGPLLLNGPCYNKRSPRIEIKGTLRALPDLSKFPSTNWIVFKDLYGFNIVGASKIATLDGQGAEDAWKQSRCREKSRCAKLVTSLNLVNIIHGTIRGITLSNSKGFHLGIHDSYGINVTNVTIRAPGDSPNTDGIHINGSSNINVTASDIGVGDDCVSIGPGTNNLSISGIQCGPGHGISVGSLGKYKNEGDVIGIDISMTTIKDTQNGVRVKTWPGAPSSSAKNLTFRDIIMVNVSNPVLIDQEYCPSHSCNAKQASHVKLIDILIKNISGTYNTEHAVTLRCSTAVACENLRLVSVALTHVQQPDGQGQKQNSSTDHQLLSMKGSFLGFKILNSDFQVAEEPSSNSD